MNGREESEERKLHFRVIRWSELITGFGDRHVFHFLLFCSPAEDGLVPVAERDFCSNLRGEFSNLTPWRPPRGA